MCKSAKQMETLFQGIKPSTTTIGFKLMAEITDDNFKILKREIIESHDILKKDISDSNTDLTEKITTVIELLKSNKEDTDKSISALRTEYKTQCLDHKKELAEKFNKIDAVTEDINYFKKNPKVFIILAAAIVLIIGYALGTSDLFGFMKAIK